MMMMMERQGRAALAARIGMGKKSPLVRSMIKMIPGMAGRFSVLIRISNLSIRLAFFSILHLVLYLCSFSTLYSFRSLPQSLNTLFLYLLLLPVFGRFDILQSTTKSGSNLISDGWWMCGLCSIEKKMPSLLHLNCSKAETGTFSVFPQSYALFTAHDIDSPWISKYHRLLFLLRFCSAVDSAPFRWWALMCEHVTLRHPSRSTSFTLLLLFDVDLVLSFDSFFSPRHQQHSQCSKYQHFSFHFHHNFVIVENKYFSLSLRWKTLVFDQCSVMECKD